MTDAHPAVSPALLQRLRCPLTKTPLRLLDPSEIDRINQQISAGQVRDHVDAVVERAIDGGLISDDAQRVYPIRAQIPSFIVEESIVWPA